MGSESTRYDPSISDAVDRRPDARTSVDLGAFTSGLLTGLREGVEAALIVSIVITYLVRTGRSEQANRVWLGTGVAAVLSLAVGIVIYNTVGAFEEPYEQIFEGTTLLIA